jgi:hypothetical protein
MIFSNFYLIVYMQEIKNAAEAGTETAAAPNTLPSGKVPDNGEAAGTMSKNQLKKLKKREAYVEIAIIHSS